MCLKQPPTSRSHQPDYTYSTPPPHTRVLAALEVIRAAVALVPLQSGASSDAECWSALPDDLKEELYGAVEELYDTYPTSSTTSDPKDRLAMQGQVHVVPPGVFPGQTFRVIIPGQTAREMIVTCPKEAGPGACVRVLQPLPPAADESCDDAVKPTRRSIRWWASGRVRLFRDMSSMEAMNDMAKYFQRKTLDTADGGIPEQLPRPNGSFRGADSRGDEFEAAGNLEGSDFEHSGRSKGKGGDSGGARGGVHVGGAGWTTMLTGRHAGGGTGGRGGKGKISIGGSKGKSKLRTLAGGRLVPKTTIGQRSKPSQSRTKSPGPSTSSSASKWLPTGTGAVPLLPYPSNMLPTTTTDASQHFNDVSFSSPSSVVPLVGSLQPKQRYGGDGVGEQRIHPICGSDDSKTWDDTPYTGNHTNVNQIRGGGGGRRRGAAQSAFTKFANDGSKEGENGEGGGKGGGEGGGGEGADSSDAIRQGLRRTPSPGTVGSALQLSRTAPEYIQYMEQCR